MRKKKCEQYWPKEKSDVANFEYMSINFIEESNLEDENNQTVKDLIHRSFEVTNLNSGNYILERVLF